jgi:hypothetical protein
VKVQEALAHVMEDVRGVAKKDKNTAQGFNFRGIDAVVNAVGPALRKHNVVVVPLVEDYDYSTVEVGQRRTPMAHVVVRVRYRFVGEEGDSLDAVVIGEAMDSGDKAVPKAMSVAFRTALLQSLALPTDEQDPDAASYERAPAKPAITKAALAKAVQTFAEAVTVDDLDAAAAAVRSEYDIPEPHLSALRDAFLTRKTAIEATA